MSKIRKTRQTVMALPKRSMWIVAVALTASLSLLAYQAITAPLPVWTWIAILLVSGFLADAITAFAHFGFDYLFPYETPILGPIAREFNEHHNAPALDPGNLIDNLTKGAYASLLVSALTGCLAVVLPPTAVAQFIVGVASALTIWTLLFHQMHSYAHMGAVLSSDQFRRHVEEIANLESTRAQRQAFRKLFAEVPIPPILRALQALGLTLNPERHNLHHVHFESDFSSVNGWSDPFLNPILRPLARKLKGRRAARQINSPQN